MTCDDIRDPLERTICRQRQAANPEGSAWLSANAGTGKTRVLTDRVMRLLLEGTEPSKILCITFTKAAAAQMAERLFSRLGEWALLDDRELREKLHELDGSVDHPPGKLSRARKLFAQALETPGGLKIQTIHSFCDSVLKRFPVEAGIAPGFAVATELAANQLLQEQIDGLASRLLRENPDLAAAFFTLTGGMNSKTMRETLTRFSAEGAVLARGVEEQGGLEKYEIFLKTMLNIETLQSAEEIWAPVRNFAAKEKASLTEAVTALREGSEREQDSALKLQNALAALEAGGDGSGFGTFFLTTNNTVIKNVMNKGTGEKFPAALAALNTLKDLFGTAHENAAAYDIFQSTVYFHKLALAVHTAYVAQKNAAGLLDFNDLVALTGKLFQDKSAAWVLYKLDQGISHILVDEAQDTSPPQWDVIWAPLLEFFAGAGAMEGTRTVFVVGDEKQSIYSFQGANVDLFNQKRGELHPLVSSVSPFTADTLDLSFRSVPAILNFVDEVFRLDRASKGVSQDTQIRHDSHREGEGGLVEIWPLVEKEKAEKGDYWDTPLDQTSESDPARVLAARIARQIRDWLDNGENLTSRNRPVRPGDIMILCQRRGKIFHALVQELRRLDIPTSGADRLKLPEHAAVLDIRSLLRYCLQTDDDLSLAEILKSPLYGLEDEDLFELAHDRESASLHSCLLHAPEDDFPGPLKDKTRLARDELDALRRTGLKKGPHALLDQLLSGAAHPDKISGWKRFFTRLGPVAREPLQELLAEALDFEASHPRSLQGFLAHLERLETDIKKEISGDEDLVRLMTVHGSKGLEANIVFLADAAWEGSQKREPILRLESPQHAPLLFHAPSSRTDCAVTKEISIRKKQEGQEEYRRLFYVAATRARDRLYICGILSGQTGKDRMLGKSPEEASWYALSNQAFEKLDAEGRIITATHPDWPEGDILRLECQQTKMPKEEEPGISAHPSPPPVWLGTPAPAEQAVRHLNPSRIALEEETVGQDIPPALSPLLQQERDSGIDPRDRGTALHLLLEKLPDIPPAERENAAHRLLTRHYPRISESFYTDWLAEVIAILDHPDFSELFSPKARAEVPVAGRPVPARNDIVMNGIIDRLLVTDSRVLIVDYKSNRPPPMVPEETAPAYLVQMAAYRALARQIWPGRQVDCALLWTWQARLMSLPPALLDQAFKKFATPRQA